MTGTGPPPLRPFGLRLHRDGSWTHEGIPVTNPRLRRVLDRGVRYLPEERKYVVQVGPFRAQIEVEEAGFFVLAFDAERAELWLSDRTREPLRVGTLTTSRSDGAVLCRIKQDRAADGLPARFTQAAQASLWLAAEETGDGPALRLGGRLHPVPRSLLG